MSKRKVSTRVKEKVYLFIVRSAITFPVIVFPKTPRKIYSIHGMNSSFLWLIVLDMGPRLVVEALTIELIHVGAWRSLVAYLNGVQRAGGSNPLAPTRDIKGLADRSCPFFVDFLVFVTICDNVIAGGG